MRIGVIGDTHIPTRTPVLPADIGEAFSGVDILMHVGDICELYVLEEFQETYTLTFAVAGDDDSDAVRRFLEERRVVRFGDRRIGMIHGYQYEYHRRSLVGRIRRLLGWGASSYSLPAFLADQFVDEDVHAIVFGHTHQPTVMMHEGILLFNPGAALPGPGLHPSVGILDVGKRSLTGKIVHL
jgi:putative phosphoesterase